MYTPSLSYTYRLKSVIFPSLIISQRAGDCQVRGGLDNNMTQTAVAMNDINNNIKGIKLAAQVVGVCGTKCRKKHCLEVGKLVIFMYAIIASNS
jgi:hypothetical protein